MKRSEFIFALILVALDYFMVALAALIAYSLRFGALVSDIRPVLYAMPFQAFVRIALVAALLWIAIFAISGLYALSGTRKFLPELSKIILACSTSVFIVILAFFFQRDLFSSRFIVLAAWILSIAFVTIGRAFVRFIQQSLFQEGVGVHRVALVGGDDTTERIAKELYKNPRLGFSIVGRFPNFNETSKKAMESLAEKGVDEIFQTEADLQKNEQWDLIDFANEHHITFRYAADLLRTQAVNIEISTVAGIPLFEVKKTPLEGWGKILKRIFDIAVSFVLLLATLPITLLTAIAIKLDSRGPVFFSYRRIGEHGKPFMFLKFRSMIHGAHALKPQLLARSERKEGGPLFKMKNDPRVTRVGKFIRRWSLDELPQFFLVLKGDMSLVGPRPHEMEEVAKYQKHHKRVLEIKPGITGTAQVSGRSDLSFEDEVRLDTHYIENWSLLLDIFILLKTPLAVIRSRDTL